MRASTIALAAFAPFAGSFVACALSTQGEAPLFGARDGAADGSSYIDASALTPAADANANGGSDAANADACGGATCVSAIALGGNESCAIVQGRGVMCWGQNDNGQLGRGTAGGAAASPAPVALPDVVDLAVGGAVPAPGASDQAGSVCALIKDGTVQCWGNDGNGQLGRGVDGGGPDSVPHPTASQVNGVMGAREIAFGASHACARDDDGGVWCWGFAANGELARTTTPSDPQPARVVAAFASTPVHVAAGGHHSCAVESAGNVECWGLNSNGQLGRTLDGGSSDSTPAVVAGVHAQRVVGGQSHSCALLVGGSIACWGYNLYGQLGRGTETAAEPTPVDVGLPANSTAVDLCAGAAHSCAVLSDGVAWCWGNNAFGQLGFGTVDASSNISPSASSTPVRASVTNAVRIACGAYHTCAVLKDGSVACWGSNAFGQIGLAPPDAKPHPMPVAVTFP